MTEKKVVRFGKWEKNFPGQEVEKVKDKIGKTNDLIGVLKGLRKEDM